MYSTISEKPFEQRVEKVAVCTKAADEALKRRLVKSSSFLAKLVDEV